MERAEALDKDDIEANVNTFLAEALQDLANKADVNARITATTTITEDGPLTEVKIAVPAEEAE